MVGHTGVLEAAVKAVEAVDAGLKRVIKTIVSKGGVALVTADHGNAEHMTDTDGGAFTAHTLSPVPLVVIDAQTMGAEATHLQEPLVLTAQMKDSAEPPQRRLVLERQQPARLADIAPTLLDLMELPIPPEFTGRSLLIRN